MVRRASLEAYRRKRDPERTPEPFGGRASVGPPVFVVQQHAARRLHYDFRLEMDGVLKSWAVPRGPSVRSEEKRLAVHVEDHPLEYATFEGVIPPDNYGAGAVIVWDLGWYRLAAGEDALTQYARGKLDLELFGYKMRGRWTLVRLARSEKDWLLLKKPDGFSADEELIDRYPRSVISGLTVDEIRDVPAKLEAVRAHCRSLGASRRPPSARDQAFMLAAPGERPFSGADWLFEIKYDGVRVMAERVGDDVHLYGRRGQVITPLYPEIAEALRALPERQFIIDGEIVALDETGRPSFQRLQARMHVSAPRDVEALRAAVPVVAVFFDCLALEGFDLRSLPLLQRKACLDLLLPPLGRVRYGDHVLEHGEAFFEAASEQRLEGIVAKKITSRYAGGRSHEWVKIKCQRRQEFVIGGYTEPRGSRPYFGALHLGLYEGSKLAYVSKVGTGFDQASLRRLWEMLQALRRASSPFDARSPTGRGHHWVEPKLVCEVRFAEWTADGGIRHPAFVGLRPDKRPEDCRREGEAPSAAEGPSTTAIPPSPAAPAARHGLGPGQARSVRISNPGKVFWPEEGYTKVDIIHYYEALAPLLLPYLKDRPVVLTRYPDGIAGKSFFQKDVPPFVPSWIRTERIYSKEADREINYFIADNVDTLRYLVNLGTIPLHVWGSRLGSLERPDWLVLDLDPKGAAFADVVAVALVLHQLLEEIALPHYVKTSGSTGLHILVPLGARYPYESARAFARLLALLAVEATPDLATLARPLRSRQGRVYVDYGQNGHGRTIVAPFSLRPLPGAPASCPLEWTEVTPRLDPRQFTLRTVPPRFAAMRDPMRAVLRQSVDLGRAIARIEKRLGRTTSR
ncbi:MAG: DNA ligase D [Armatimonadota bacterium]|nr:DNA ligase D [Armatimonadota bacterium]